MMKRTTFFLLAPLITLSQFIYAQGGYEYTVTIKGMEDTVLILGHHYGSRQYVVDTVPTDNNGTAVFSGDTPLDGGVYLVVMPKMNNQYFEMIVSEPKFSMRTDMNDVTGAMEVEGSLENEVMYRDLQFIKEKRNELNSLEEKLNGLAEDDAKREPLMEEINKVNNEVLEWREKLYREYPDAFYTKLVKAAQEITIPEAPVNEDGTTDQQFAYKYLRQHYFDDVDFQDPRMVRTNVISTKVDRYLEKYVPKAPDSIGKAIDFIVDKARGNDDLFQYLVVTLLNKYASSDIMGMDAVFVHMVDQYYKSGDAFWLDDAGLYRITSKADAIRPTLIGKQAPNIVLQDTAGNDIPLYSITTDFLVVVFWDVDCHHCQKEMPKILEAYPGLKELGAEVYAVYSQEEWDKWVEWLDDKKYPWINVGNLSGKSPFQVLYNVDQTPLMFIMDKNKKIIGKRLSGDQMIDFLERYIEFHD